MSFSKEGIHAAMRTRAIAKSEAQLAQRVAEPAPAAPPAPPADITVIARDPAEMARAQEALVAWAVERIERAKADYDEVHENYEIAVKNKWRSDLLKRKTVEAQRMIEFWEKVHAALQEGYCIVPSLPVDVFAIRTTRKTPTHHYTTGAEGPPQETNRPALGDGRYVAEQPTYNTEVVEKNYRDGTSYKTNAFWPNEFADVQFPVAMVKPTIMSETARAMARKIFDDVGLLPQRRSKGDPIIVGRVHYPKAGRHNPHGGPRTIDFLIAWWIDTAAL